VFGHLGDQNPEIDSVCDGLKSFVAVLQRAHVLTGKTYCSTHFIMANMIMRKLKLNVLNNSSAGSCTPTASGMVAAGDPHCARVRVHFFNESFSQHVFDGFGERLRQHENDAICSVRRMYSKAPVR
jgi:hypothetical protein